MIKQFKTISQMQKLRQSLKGTVGFVPTMGFLHEGHLSLIRKAKQENDVVIVSIFVNPLQFGKTEDYNIYPRDISNDLSLLQSINTNIVFLPKVSDMYPKGSATYIEVTGLSDKLEGKSRPGHFKGVTTVVDKLFNIIQPTKAYFGQKDAQQVAIIKKMVSDLHFPIEIVVGETIREKDGLAMSSRNIFLSKSQREEAPILYESLLLAKSIIAKGIKDTQIIKFEMRKLINKTQGRIDYISIADQLSLDEVKVINTKAFISLAVLFGKTRLIDNTYLRSS